MIRRRTLTLWGIAVGSLALWLWWTRSEKLSPGPLLREATVQGGDYHFKPRPGVMTSALVHTAYLDDYDPRQESEFLEALDGRSSRYVREDDRHHYVEYMGRYSRIQVHTALEDDGIDQWLEFVPSNASVDAFFIPDVAILLDSARSKYKVYIPNATDHTYMTVLVSDGRVVHVFWTRHYVLEE